jgi:CBS domain-containing protein
MRPATTVAYGVMSKGAVDLALMLSLLQAGIMDDKLFSLLVLGTLITMVISSVELQRKLKKIITVKVGTSELGLVPIFFRRVVSDTQAAAVMDTEFSKTKADVTIKEYCENNNDLKIPSLVFDKGDNLIGIVSKKEIEKSHKNTRDLTTVADIMYRKFHTTLPDDYLFTVIQKMNSHPFDMIPIVDPKNTRKVIGVVTSEAMMNLLTETKKP